MRSGLQSASVEAFCCHLSPCRLMIPNCAGISVAHVLADPERFEGATLADPLEGIELRTL